MKSWPDLPELFDLSATQFARLFSYLEQPWEALSALESYLGILLAEDPLLGTTNPEAQSGLLRGDIRMGKGTVVEPGARIEGLVHIGAGSVVETGAYIRGPAWIGQGCEVRQGAYLRGLVLAGDGAVLGHASEFKRCVLLEGAQAPHFNYVGDSVMGIRAHIGAGVILSNVRLDKKNVRSALLSDDPKPRLVETGLAKFGAILGDGCEVGCNSVLNPGTILGSACAVPPLSRVRGSYPAGTKLG
jgi:UDP-N-acetylglucosamine diphosphorylase / glucose-1-phosphate thymidylyltransferase / UDP-N-acetylgalactosamine diphosphorylase / glucosamine-1-phosphate N-acetyltransferase / galactosamine-1-phosphate N-acetyltransferase